MNLLLNLLMLLLLMLNLWLMMNPLLLLLLLTLLPLSWVDPYPYDRVPLPESPPPRPLQMRSLLPR